MQGVNKVIVIGQLGRDTDIRYTGAGMAMATISVAVDEAWKGKDGQRKTATEWVKVVLIGQHAEFAGEFGLKGRQVYVEGRLQTRKWQDKQGADRHTTEVVAKNFQLLGSKPKIDSKPEQYQPPQKSQPQQVREAYTGAGHYNEDECPF